MNSKRFLIPVLTLMIGPASRWVTEQEEMIAANGRALAPSEINDARKAGVAHPDKIRIRVVPAILPPQRFPLACAAKLVNLIGQGTAGITLRYGIYIRQDCSAYRTNRNLYVHEFVHVGQYERLGSIRAFLKEYLRECIDPGYPFGPLEQEAITKADKIVGQGDR